MSTIGIVIDQKCNIRCRHCCFSSGPQAEGHLTDEQIIDLVQKACTCEWCDTVALSGGEALLRRNLVLQCARIAADHDKKCTIVTNGFWGISPDIARLRVHEMKEAGITSFSLSVDCYHEEFISIQRLKNVLNASKSVHLPCKIDMAVSRAESGVSILEELGESAFGIEILRYPVQRAGRGQQIPESDIYKTQELQNLRCPGFEVTYHFDGQVYPCCSPLGFSSVFSIGNFTETHPEAAREKIEHNLLFAAIRRKGFDWLIQRCIDAGVSNLPKAPFVDACDCCRQLFSNSEVREALPHILSQYREPLQ